MATGIGSCYSVWKLLQCMLQCNYGPWVRGEGSPPPGLSHARATEMGHGGTVVIRWDADREATLPATGPANNTY